MSKIINGVTVSRGALDMVLNALDRDAKEGWAARGEMAQEIRGQLSISADTRKEQCKQVEHLNHLFQNFHRSILHLLSETPDVEVVKQVIILLSHMKDVQAQYHKLLTS